MAGYTSEEFKWFGIGYYISRRGIAILIAAIVISTGLPQYLLKVLEKHTVIKPKSFQSGAYLKLPALWFLLWVSMCIIVNGNYSPFIYFRF